MFREGAFPSSWIIPERSSPPMVRFAAPNKGAPWTDSGPFWTNLPDKRERPLPKGWSSLTAIAAIMVRFFTALTNYDPNAMDITGAAQAPEPASFGLVAIGIATALVAGRRRSYGQQR